MVSIFSLLSPHQHQGNEIGSSGASSLALALQNNNTLTDLNLSCKYFTFPLGSSPSSANNLDKQDKSKITSSWRNRSKNFWI
jgi:hypothetical protein